LMKIEDLSIADAAARVVAQARQAKRRLPGFGHRVHSTDPRTAILFGLAEQGGIAGDGVAFVNALEQAIASAVKPLPINIDGALAAVLHDMGFAPEFGRFVFLIGRVAGLTAEVAEELAREKPMRIRVPVEYDGVAPRDLE
jgi:citrate synthase